MSFEIPEQQNQQEQALTAFQELRTKLKEAGMVYRDTEPEVLQIMSEQDRETFLAKKLEGEDKAKVLGLFAEDSFGDFHLTDAEQLSRKGILSEADLIEIGKQYLKKQEGNNILSGNNEELSKKMAKDWLAHSGLSQESIDKILQ